MAETVEEKWTGASVGVAGRVGLADALTVGVGCADPNVAKLHARAAAGRSAIQRKVRGVVWRHVFTAEDCRMRARKKKAPEW